MLTPEELMLARILAPVLLVLMLATSLVYWRLVLRREAETEARASALLRELLTEEQYRQLAGLGYLEVPSPSVADRVYRVPSRPGYVDVYQSGEFTERLCVQPLQPLPGADLVLLHKLMIEGNEREYLRQANQVRESARWLWPM